MSSARDPQLERALTALRALEPPSNGFEVRLRGSLLQAAADPLFPRRAAAQPAPRRLWRRRPLAALSLAALSLAGVAAAVGARRWLPWPRSELASAPVLSAEPPRAALPRPSSFEAAPAARVPQVVELPPVSGPGPVPHPLPAPQGEPVSLPERPHRAVPAHEPAASGAAPLAMPEPEPPAAPVVVPRFDLPDLPAQGAEHGSAPRGERAERREEGDPRLEDRSHALDRISEARDRSGDRRRSLDRARPILDPAPGVDRDRRGPPEVRERERELPEPREPEGGGRGRR